MSLFVQSEHHATWPCRTKARKAAFSRRVRGSPVTNRLLTVFLAGAVDEAAFRAKSAELGGQMAVVEESIRKLGESDKHRGGVARTIFGWSQNAADLWRGSNSSVRRDILDLVYLNRTLGDVTLYAPKRKPFDVLAEGLKIENSRGDRI